MDYALALTPTVLESVVAISSFCSSVRTESLGSCTVYRYPHVEVSRRIFSSVYIRICWWVIVSGWLYRFISVSLHSPSYRHQIQISEAEELRQLLGQCDQPKECQNHLVGGSDSSKTTTWPENATEHLAALYEYPAVNAILRSIMPQTVINS